MRRENAQKHTHAHTVEGLWWEPLAAAATPVRGGYNFIGWFAYSSSCASSSDRLVWVLLLVVVALFLLLKVPLVVEVGSDALADGAWLAALYNATNGPSWNSGCRTNWNVANPGSVCSAPAWSSVTCNATGSNGVVTYVGLAGCNLQGGPLPDILGTSLTHCTSLDLSTNSLIGALPSSYSSLSSLQSLFLYSNSLTGGLPSSYSSMSSLQYLALYSNSLSGPLPPSYSSLSSLKYLSLFSNRLTGALPPSYGILSSLSTLALYSNSLSGGLPTSYGSLSSLQILALSSNGLTGALPSSYGSLSSLWYLALYSNSLTGGLPTSYSSLSSLRTLALYSNSLTGDLPISYSSLSALQFFGLSSNSLTGAVPAEYSSMSSLQYLALYSNSLSGGLPSSYSSLSALRTLALYSNSLSGDLPISYSSLTSLQYLSLFSNNLTGVIPTSYGSLSSLQYVALYSNTLTGGLPTSFSNLSALRTLALYSNSLTGSIPSSYSNLSSLQYLDLSSNGLTGALPSSFSVLSSLHTLAVYCNSLSGGLPTSYSSLSSLRTLALYSNVLTGALPSSYSSMSLLQYLSLYSNNLSGVIPSSYSSLSSLRTLALYSNSFVGSLPTSYSSLSSLQILALSYNGVTGPLPTSFSRLSSLQYLALSFNSFTGALPSSYSSLASLQLLDLSSNRLTGTLPSSWYALNGSTNYNVSNNYLTGDIPASWLWSNATISGEYFAGNCLNVSNMTAVAATGRFSVGTPRSNAFVCAAAVTSEEQPSQSMTETSWPLLATSSNVMTATGSVTSSQVIWVESRRTMSIGRGAVTGGGPARNLFPRATQSLALLASVATTSSSAAFVLQRSALVLRLLSSCGMSLDEIPDLMSSPTQMQIGNGVQRYQLGTVIGNACILIGIAVCCALVCCALTVFNREGGAGWKCGLLGPVAASMRLPGWLVIFWSVLLQPLVAAIACLLLLQPAAAIDVVIGLAGLSGVVLVVVLEVRLVVFRCRATLKRRTQSVLGDGVTLSFIKCLDLLGTDDFEWQDDEPNGKFVKHYGMVFEMYRPGVRRCFHLVDSLFAIVAAVLQGIATVFPFSAASVCSGEVQYTLCGLQIMYSVIVVVWRPQAETSEYIKAAIMSCLGAISAMLAVIPSCADVAVVLVQIQVYLALADLCVSVVGVMWRGRFLRFVVSLIAPSPGRAPRCFPGEEEKSWTGTVHASFPIVLPRPACTQKRRHHSLRDDESVDPVRLALLAELIERICIRR